MLPISPHCFSRFRNVLGAFVLAGFTAHAQAQLERLLAPVEIEPQPIKRVVEPEKGAAGVVSEATSSTDGGKVAESQMFTGEDLLREVKAQVIEHYSISGDLDLQLARPWGAMKVPASCALKVLEFPRDGLASVFSIPCKLMAGDQVLGEWNITLRAQQWQDVWVASMRLERGQSVDETMVNVQKVDVLKNRNVLLGVDEKLSSYEMAQIVNAGVPLTKRDVVEKPVIRKYQIVEAVIKKGALLISTKAQALENGAPKALIRMLNLDSKREFNAQVVNETQVNVLF